MCRKSACNILDAGMLSAVYFPWAITSTAKKNAGANNTHDHLVMSLAPAFYAQAVYIQDHFVLTTAAVDRQAFSLGFAADAKKSFIAFADGTLCPTIFHLYYSTADISMQ